MKETPSKTQNAEEPTCSALPAVVSAAFVAGPQEFATAEQCVQGVSSLKQIEDVSSEAKAVAKRLRIQHGPFHRNGCRVVCCLGLRESGDV